MHGAITICTVHSQVYNAKTQNWQSVSDDMLAELREMAQEIGNVEVYEGCCPVCNELAQESFKALYEHRYHTAAYAEMRNEVAMPWEGDIE